MQFLAGGDSRKALHPTLGPWEMHEKTHKYCTPRDRLRCPLTGRSTQKETLLSLGASPFERTARLIFGSAITYQVLSIDINFNPWKSHDAVPFR